MPITFFSYQFILAIILFVCLFCFAFLFSSPTPYPSPHLAELKGHQGDSSVMKLETCESLACASLSSHQARARPYFLVFLPPWCISHSTLFTWIQYLMIFCGRARLCHNSYSPCLLRAPLAQWGYEIGHSFFLISLKICFKDYVHQNHLGCLLKLQVTKPHPTPTERESLFLTLGFQG